jgi:hypothetical protein
VAKFSDKKRAKEPGPRKKRRFTLKRTVHLILEFPDKAMFEAFTNALLDKGHALDTNKQARTVSYSQKDETIIKDVWNQRGFLNMINIEEIKQAVIHLPPEDLAAFRRWYQEYDATAWDKQFEDDVKSG